MYNYFYLFFQSQRVDLNLVNINSANMTDLVTILSNRSAHIKEGCNYYFYFFQTWKKKQIESKMKKVHVLRK